MAPFQSQRKRLFNDDTRGFKLRPHTKLVDLPHPQHRTTGPRIRPDRGFRPPKATTTRLAVRFTVPFVSLLVAFLPQVASDVSKIG